ncbi:alpha/beta hydrolase [Kribbella lupini]|uniref:Alpha/beta hydrolase n=1 Tax=Kribbella lupini TaxID=291602 RepID=A0ABN2AQM2_9ACTN
MDKVISTDGTEIAYDAVGSGPGLVLVAGALTARAYYGPRAEALAESFTVITYDRRGRGDSGDQAAYSVEREVEDLEAVRAATRASYGYADSSGVMVLLRAVAAGSAFDKLAIMEPPFRVEGAPPAPERYLERLQEFVAAGNPGGALELFMVEAVGQPKDQVDGMKASPYWPALEALGHTLVYDALQLGDSELPVELLGQIEQPTLALHSTASPEWLQRAVAAAAGAMRDSRVLALEGSFHEVPPEVLAPALVKHFLGHRSS